MQAPYLLENKFAFEKLLVLVIQPLLQVTQLGAELVLVRGVSRQLTPARLVLRVLHALLEDRVLPFREEQFLLKCCHFVVEPWNAWHDTTCDGDAPLKLCVLDP